MAKLDLGRILQSAQIWSHTGAAAGVQLAPVPKSWGAKDIGPFEYRLGTQDQFAHEMLLRLLTASETLPNGKGRVEPFRDFNALSDINWVVSLIDSWAGIGDVLSFYQNRHANEGFLPSAALTGSRAFLMDEVSPPRAIAIPEADRSTSGGALLAAQPVRIERNFIPAAAAEIYVGITVTAGPLRPDEVTIPEGSEITLHMVKDGRIVPFTTTCNLNALTGASTLFAAQQGVDQTVDLQQGATALHLASGVGLSVGDQLFLHSGARTAAGLPEQWRLVTLDSVDKCISGTGVLVTWQGAKDAPPLPDVKVAMLDKSYAPYGKHTVPLAAATATQKIQNLKGGGVQRMAVADTDWTTLNIGLPTADIADVAFVAGGDVALATQRGVYVAPQNGSAPYFAENTGLRSRDITSFATAQDGMLYCAGTNGLVARTDQPEKGWSLVLGNRSLVPSPGDKGQPLNTALPRTLVRRVRVGPKTDQASPPHFTFVLMGDGIYANGMGGDGWRHANPPVLAAGGSAPNEGIAQKTGQTITDFLTFSRNGQATVLAATDKAIVHYTVPGSTAAKGGRIFRRLERLASAAESLWEDVKPALPDVGKWIDLEGRKVVEMAFVDWSEGRKQLLVATQKAVFAYHGPTGGLHALMTGAPDGPVLSLSVPSQPMPAGSYGLDGVLAAVAAYPSGLYGYVLDDPKWAAGDGFSGSWTLLKAFAAEARTTAPLTGAVDPARSQSLPHVNPRVSFAQDGTMVAITPMESAPDWDGLTADPSAMQLLPVTPDIKEGQMIVAVQSGAAEKPVVAKVASASVGRASGFGLPARPVQQVGLVPAQGGTGLSGQDLRGLSVYSLGAFLQVIAPEKGRETVLLDAAVTLADAGPVFEERAVGVFGRPARCVLPTGGGILRDVAKGNAVAALAGADVLAMTSRASRSGPVLAALAASHADPFGSVVMSTDGGTSWATATFDLKDDILALAQAGTGPAFVLTKGTLWTVDFADTTRDPNWAATDLPKSPAALTRLWATPEGQAFASGPGAGLWRYQDGAGWSAVILSHVPQTAHVTAMAWRDDARGVLAVAETGLWKWHNNTYQPVAPAHPIGPVLALAIDTRSDTLLVGGRIGGVYALGLRNNTARWHAFAGRHLTPVCHLAVDGARWIAAASGQICVSSNQGLSWDATDLGAQNNVSALCLVGPEAPGTGKTPNPHGDWDILVGRRLGCLVWGRGNAPDVLRPVDKGTLPAVAAAWLDQGALPATLVTAFKGLGITLPKGSVAEPLVQGNSWLITAPTPDPEPANQGRMTSHVPTRASAAKAGAEQSAGGVSFIATRASPESLRVFEPVLFDRVTRAGRDGVLLPDAMRGPLMLDHGLADLVFLSPDPTAKDASEVAVAAQCDGKTLQLGTPLQQVLARSTAVFNANMCHAIEGRLYRDEPLSREPGSMTPVFDLPSAPLTFVRGKDKGARHAVLEIKVQGETWIECANTGLAGPNDKVYQLRLSPTGVGEIRFGDGQHGKKPTLAHGAIRATYLAQQTLLSAPQTPPEKQPPAGGDADKALATLGNVPNGVSPIGATIWAKHAIAQVPPAGPIAGAQNMRGAAHPPKLSTKEGIADFVTSLETVAQCEVAIHVQPGGRTVIGLALGGVGGRTVALDAPELLEMAQKITRELPLPGGRVQLIGARKRGFEISAEVWLRHGHDAQHVEIALREAIADCFGAAEHRIGQGVSKDRLAGLLQGVAGVRGVTIDSVQPCVGGGAEDMTAATKMRFNPQDECFSVPTWWLADDAAFRFVSGGGA